MLSFAMPGVKGLVPGLPCQFLAQQRSARGPLEEFREIYAEPDVCRRAEAGVRRHEGPQMR